MHLLRNPPTIDRQRMMQQYVDRGPYVAVESGARNDTDLATETVLPEARCVEITSATDDEEITAPCEERFTSTFTVSSAVLDPTSEARDAIVSLPPTPRRRLGIALATPAQMVEMSKTKKILAMFFLATFGLFGLIFGLMFSLGMTNSEHNELTTLSPTTTTTTTMSDPTKIFDDCDNQTMATTTITTMPDPTKLFADSICTLIPNSCPALLDEISPQRRALEWLVSNPDFFFYTQHKKMQRFALATLHYSITELSVAPGSKWRKASSDECSWHTMVKKKLFIEKK